MKFSNLKVSTRLLAAFALMFLGALALGGAGWSGISQQANLTTEVLDKDVEFSRAVASIRTRVQMLRRFEKDMLFNIADAAKAAGYKKQWDESRSRIDELLAKARAAASTDEERSRLDKFATAIGHYTTAIGQVAAGIASKEIATAEQGYAKVAEFRQEVRDTETLTGELFEGANKRVDAVKPALAAVQKSVLLILVAVALVVAVLATLTGALITRSITGPVAEAVRVTEALARGDLSQKVEVRSRDEIGRMMQALKGTLGQLTGIVQRIKESSDTMATASREIAQGNMDLSSRTEQQASALEETSASLQQMTATVGQNAQNAKKANELAAQASGVAAKGGEVVKEAVGTMNGITESSKKIADIIGVIDGIAFQTNILALNAAVEAARAGEQGRGFAVVASEVRSLAQRSAAAAKEIKDLITDSVAKVDAGSRQVNDTGRTMEEIVASVKKVTTLIAEIAAASQEQAQGIEQVSETMTQLEKVTQQNAAMVEEASAAAGSLEQQSGALSSAVAEFKLSSEHSAVAMPAAAAKLLPVAPAPAPTPAAAKPEAKQPEARKPLEARKPVEPKKKRVEPFRPLPTREAYLNLPPLKPAAGKKGNGHLEEGWQEF